VNGCPPGRRLLPVAGATKPPLSRCGREDVDALDVSALRGMVEYDPAELTFTARAATPVAEVCRLLAEHDQYLPFDPPLARAGATLGGVVAAGASGPNALRHGTVRDFVIGVRLVDGLGRLVSGGGKVVKNAAGFDLPKLMVGSIGRLGVMTQLSLKVFPRPRATVTLEFRLGDTGTAVAAACAGAAGPRELDAVDVLPGGRLLVRLGGDPAALPARVTRLGTGGIPAGPPVATYEAEAERTLWDDVAELRWAAERTTIVRVPVTARSAVALERMVAAEGGEARLSLAANVAWVAWPHDAPLADLDQALRGSRLSGMVLSGVAAEPLIGLPVRNPFGERIRRALDPDDRFLEV
jgi:glycolate dehydrogenase FAD-binding subunit